MKASELLHPRPEGLYCPPGDFYVDAMRPVPRALITHAHSDHARPGHGAVMASRETLAIMALRLGEGFCETRQEAKIGEWVNINGVEVAFFPAGHVLGSCQIALKWKGLTIVISGDYKREPDATAAPFEVVPCDVFVTEATFGLPVFRHPDPAKEVASCLSHCRKTRSARISWGLTRWVKRSASSATCARRGMTGRSISMARSKR